jgi:hypothetical protein
MMSNVEKKKTFWNVMKGFWEVDWGMSPQLIANR